MLKKVLPLILLLFGSGAGVGAGIFLRPDAVEPQALEASKDEVEPKDDLTPEEDSSVEYVKLSNQFVVPIVKDEQVAAMVVLSLSLEVPEGQKDAVFLREPKLRDSFLQVLFDHANVGGFDGAFTSAQKLKSLRTALLEIAQKDLVGEDVIDVLITEIARQDY